MIYCKIVVSCLVVVLLNVGTYHTYGQEGVSAPSSSYYQPRVAINYPLLAGNRIAVAESTLGSSEEFSSNLGPIHSGCGCGRPLLPAIAQGLRETLAGILPRRGMSRIRGLLFSEWFYGSNCYGCGEIVPGVIYESDTTQEPTPATSVEEVPAKVAPATSLLLPSTQGQRAVGNGVQFGLVRPVNYSVPNATRIPSIPDNPLRR